MGGNCPFGKGCEIDSPSCRKCEHFYRTGTGTFFWCKHPDAHKPAEIAQPKRKRGRPPGKTAKTKKKTTRKGRTPKKAILRPVKVIKQEIK